MTAALAGLSVRWRVPVLLTAGLALFGGLYAGLLLLGTRLPQPPSAVQDVHGPVMVFGFVGTLIALERAVALGRRWALLAPACSGAGALLLLTTGPGWAGKTAMMAASVVLLGVYRALWARQQSVALLAQAAGAFGWYAATLLWLAGVPIGDLVTWMVVFVVATIAGERRELAHVTLLPAHADRWFPAAVAALPTAATAAAVWPRTGTHLVGFALLALAAWLAVFDVARRTVRGSGLPRYAAVGLLAGYGWLAAAGLLWAGAGPAGDGARYDATLHAVFLGFTMSMIFVHAPVILPAVLRRPLPYHPVLYGPFAFAARLAAGPGRRRRRRGRGAGVALGRRRERHLGAGLPRLRGDAVGDRRPPGTHPGARRGGTVMTAALSSGRAAWHRRSGALPLAYLAALVAVGLAHPALPAWRWLAIHLLLLGAATNAILVWGAHFTAAVLRIPAPPDRRSEAARLGVLNAGVIAVLAGGATDLAWVGVAGAGAVFAAVAGHLRWMAGKLRSALPARFTVTVHYYLAASVALLTGIPAGAWMLVDDDDDAARPRLLLLHAHLNLLGWIMLTVLGTVLTLWPTVLRTRMADDAVAASRTALPIAVTGLTVLAIAVLAWWPAVAAAGLALFALAVLRTVTPAARAAGAKPPESFAAWSIAAGAAWLLAALAIDACTLLAAGGPDAAVDRFGIVLIPLLAGSVAQILLGALSYLLPMALGGGPATVRQRTSALDRHWPQRVAMTNAALVAFLLPAGPYVRITTSLLLLAALLQFLIPAARVLLKAWR